MQNTSIHYKDAYKKGYFKAQARMVNDHVAVSINCLAENSLTLFFSSSEVLDEVIAAFTEAATLLDEGDTPDFTTVEGRTKWIQETIHDKWMR